jgi:hypothetical protein
VTHAAHPSDPFMTSAPAPRATRPAAPAASFGDLPGQLAWLVRLRWLTAGGVLIGWAVDRAWLGLYTHTGAWMVAVGVGLVAYNAALWLLLRGWRADRRAVRALAAAQVLLDLACLTLLTVWTGGARSPLLGFFVFHMVFASLLLPRGRWRTSARPPPS